MKGSWKFVLLLTAVAAVACTKEWTGRRLSGAGIKKSPGTSQAVFASEWTTLSHWQKDRQGFFVEQPFMQPGTNGKVLLFARRLWQADEGFQGEDIPMQLPLHFLPYTDRPGLMETWQYELSGDKLRVNLAIEGAENVRPREVSVRYVVIPDTVWKELATVDTVTDNWGYEDLVAKLDLTP